MRFWRRRPVAVLPGINVPGDPPEGIVHLESCRIPPHQVEVADIPELFGPGRPYVTRDDGVILLGEVGQTDWDDTKRWHAKVTDWNDVVVYDGPAPVPEDVANIGLDDALEGRMYHFEMTPLD